MGRALRPYDWLPGGVGWLRGLIYRLFIVVVSNWTVVPMVKVRGLGQSDQLPLGGLDP